jgi:hypothetical protein
MADRKRKLHEVLGSQGQTFKQAEKVRTDLLNTFEKKRHLFGETLVRYTANAEGSEPVTESQSTLQSIVAQELEWITPILAKAMDSEATIDEGNTVARADVLLDNGATLLTQVPATQLLQLDKRLGELLQFVQGIPTLDPAKGFTLDKDRGKGIFQAREVRKTRTKKEQVALVAIQPTQYHPGQASIITKDVEVGTIVEQEWSALITPATKATMMERVEELRRAVKQARARANDVEVKEIKIGRQVLDYVFGPATTSGLGSIPV